jgi:hypothetical protein
LGRGRQGEGKKAQGRLFNRVRSRRRGEVEIWYLNLRFKENMIFKGGYHRAWTQSIVLLGLVRLKNHKFFLPKELGFIHKDVHNAHYNYNKEDGRRTFPSKFFPDSILKQVLIQKIKKIN